MPKPEDIEVQGSLYKSYEPLIRNQFEKYMALLKEKANTEESRELYFKRLEASLEMFRNLGNIPKFTQPPANDYYVELQAMIRRKRIEKGFKSQRALALQTEQHYKTISRAECSSYREKLSKREILKIINVLFTVGTPEYEKVMDLVEKSKLYDNI